MKSLNRGHARVLKNLSVIERCPLLGGNFKKILTFGTKPLVHYSWHVRYLGCPLLGGLTTLWKKTFGGEYLPHEYKTKTERTWYIQKMSSENFIINVQFTSCVQGVLRKPFITKGKSKYFRPLKSWDLFTFIKEVLHGKFQNASSNCSSHSNMMWKMHGPTLQKYSEKLGKKV